MTVKSINPILNVSNLQESFQWFEKLGWEKGFEWGTPPVFGGVFSGEYSIYLCEGSQGGRGKGPTPVTFGPEGNGTGEKGVWIWISVDSIDAVYQTCLEHGLEVTLVPDDMPWDFRETHVQHPDGHILRFTQFLEKETATSAE